MEINQASLISFSGLDGSGKSTLIGMLSAKLDQCGIPHKVVWAKFGLHPLGRITALIRRKNQPLQKTLDQNEPVESRNLFRFVYMQILLWSYYLILRRRVLAPLRRGYLLLCDRYTYDTIVDLVVELGLDTDRAEKLMTKIWIPKPDLAFWLNIDPVVAQSRKDDALSISHGNARITQYQEISNKFSLIEITGDLSPEESLAVIIEKIKEITGIEI
jgi:thymidylate kinase